MSNGECSGKMNKPNFIFILIFFLALTVTSHARDGSVKTVGLARFSIYPINLPGRIEECIPLDLNQDGLTDLLITHRPKGSQTRLVSVIFHRPEKGLSSQSLQTWSLPPEATALVCGDYIKAVPGIEIGYLAPDGVYIYVLDNPAAYKLNPYVLLKVTTLFSAPDEDALPVWQLPVDLDNNQADDLIIPEQDGYTIYFQSVESTSGFTPVKIEVPCRQIVKKENTSWLTITDQFAPLRIVDVNQDGLKDLVSFDQGYLIYYIQSARGRSLPQADPAKERGALGGQGSMKFSMMRFELKYLKDVLQDKEISTSSIIFSDINQDGLIDFVISALGGKVAQLSKLVTRCFIYLASPDSDQVGGLSYPDTPNQIINLKGISPLMDIGDVNNDGKMDLLLASFQTSFGSNLKKAFLRYVRVNYQLHLFQPRRGRFSRKPDYQHKTNLPFKLVGKGQKYFSHFYLQYDYNNDGRSDRLTISGPDKKRGILAIRLGWPAEKLINKNGVGFKKDEYLLYPLRIPQRLLVHDLNNDQRADLVLQYKSNLLIMMSK